MNKLYLGEKIKKLRLERGITQETLAEYMNVSSPAVSKWERGESMPDITMVIPLASFFGVSTDELLGVDAAKDEIKINDYIRTHARLGAVGKTREQLDIIMRAYNEFPNDWRIISLYITELQISHPLEEHKEELYLLANRVLNECTVDAYRYSAMSTLINLYKSDNNTEKALEVANSFPEYFMNRGEMLESCYERGSDDWQQHLRHNIFKLKERLMEKIGLAALNSDLDPREKIRIYKKALAVNELMIDMNDYNYSHFSMYCLYFPIAEQYAVLKEYDTAIMYCEKALYHAKKYDELSRVSVHKSFLLKGYIHNKSYEGYRCEDNQVAKLITMIQKSKMYYDMKDLPKMVALIASYTPFSGKKKDYSKDL